MSDDSETWTFSFRSYVSIGDAPRDEVWGRSVVEREWPEGTVGAEIKRRLLRGESLGVIDVGEGAPIASPRLFRAAGDPGRPWPRRAGWRGAVSDDSETWTFSFRSYVSIGDAPRDEVWGRSVVEREWPEGTVGAEIKRRMLRGESLGVIDVGEGAP